MPASCNYETYNRLFNSWNCSEPPHIILTVKVENAIEIESKENYWNFVFAVLYQHRDFVVFSGDL